MEQYGFSSDPVAITTSTIPNPGITGTQRIVAGLGVAGLVGVAGLFAITWPVHIAFASIWGPTLLGVGSGAAAILAIRKRKTAMQLAIDEFVHLGVAPEIVGSVIVENRAQAWTVASYKSSFPKIQMQVDTIANEVLAIIDGFKDDVTDIQRCRHVLTQCLDQAIKILQNLEVIERRITEDNSISADEYEDTIRLSTSGLRKIADALVEQHRRNLDNNQNALEIDISVSKQLLQ